MKIFILLSIIFLSGPLWAGGKISSKPAELLPPVTVTVKRTLIIPECRIREDKYYTQGGGGGFITPTIVGFCNCDGGGGMGGAGYFPAPTSHLRVDIYPDCPPPYYIEEEVKENE